MKYLKFVFIFVFVGILLAGCDIVDNLLYDDTYDNNEYYNNNEDYDNEDFNNENDNEDNQANHDENAINEDASNENSEEHGDGETSATMTTLVIQPILASAPAAFNAFSKYIDVFGVNVYATSDLSDAKILHAAAVMAEYLDNNEDGVADNPKVIATMQANHATLIMFASENSMESFIEAMEDAGMDPGQGFQPLFEFEINLNAGEFDATLEEVLHLITQFGYANAYPEIWGERRGTAVADAMDLARGGYFKTVPSSYPSGAWYTYDDRTCEYECMLAEYTYWSLTTLLGGQDGPGRGAEIEHEWSLNTPEAFRNGDPTMYALLTDPANGMPTSLPDGNYSP